MHYFLIGMLGLLISLTSCAPATIPNHDDHTKLDLVGAATTWTVTVSPTTQLKEVVLMVRAKGIAMSEQTGWDSCAVTKERFVECDAASLEPDKPVIVKVTGNVTASLLTAEEVGGKLVILSVEPPKP